MTANELKRMRRSDLLEIILQLRKENDQLRLELEQTRQELENRTIDIEKSGSLAEAALKLNGVFEAAQAACEQYTMNILQRCQRLEKECEARAAAADADAVNSD